VSGRARIETAENAIVRPIVVGRCDGDSLPIHRHVSRPMQAGLKAGVIDPAVGHMCGPVTFAGPFAIGHECVAEVVEVGAAVTGVTVGDRVVVPWAVSCGTCAHCARGLTASA
jgi:threonine dehydrogenase-like Zn-dependent dehydrogenase